MSEISPDGRDYNRREQWTRPEWRKIHRRDLRLCKCDHWTKKEVLEKNDGQCRRCKQKAEQEKIDNATG